MKTFQKIFFILFTTVYVSCSNNNKDPKVVAESFYNAVNDGDFKTAMEYANTETKEKLNNLEKLSTLSEELPYEFLEIEDGKETYVTGDTVKVKYKIGKRKDDLTLVYNSEEESFKVIYGVNSIRKIKLSSIDLYNLKFPGKVYNREDKEIKARIENDYYGIRFEVTDLLLHKSSSGSDIIDGIPYDKTNNFSPIPGCWNGEGYGFQVSDAGTLCHELFLNDKKISTKKSVYKGESFDLNTAECFTFHFDDNSETIDVELMEDITTTKQINDPNYWIPLTAIESFKFKRTFNIEGTLGWVSTGYDQYIKYGNRRGGFTVNYSEPVRLSFLNCQIIE
jgi:hypothetical protein